MAHTSQTQRERGLELEWDRERDETWKMQPEDLFGSPPGSALWLWGPLRAEAHSRGGNAKLNNRSLLKSAEAAPSGEVLGNGDSICPSRV